MRTEGGRRRTRVLAGCLALLAGLVLGPAAGLPSGPAALAAAPRTGPETGLPLPRYVSLKSAKANVRRGPGLTHRVDWVFVRRGMPLEVIAEYGHWRRVRDMDDATGWVHYSLLRGERTAVVTAETAELRASPAAEAVLVARAERGVVLTLEACAPAWCEVSRGSVTAWAPKSALWGAGPEEVFD